MAIRYGEDFAGQRQAADGPVRVGDTTVSFHPAGHILGSAQIAVQPDRGPKIVVSGDYCRHPNPVSAPYEPVPCDFFVTEATFGLPVFKHPDPAAEMAKLLASMAEFPDRAHLIGAYALGKAQRIIAHLREAGWERPIYVHGALERLNALYEREGVALGPILPTRDLPKGSLGGEVAIAPPSAIQDRWARRFAEPVAAFASGWMGVRARARQKGVELPLVVSDHADWDELTATFREVAPEEIWITHGREEGLCRWAELHGMKARALRLVGYDEEDDESLEVRPD